MRQGNWGGGGGVHAKMKLWSSVLDPRVTSTESLGSVSKLAAKYSEGKTKMAVFWVVAPCSLVEVYERLRGSCCLDHHGATTQKTASFVLTAARTSNPSIRKQD
jgi:hypothetical protein